MIMRARGFTLIELAVAVFITAVLVAIGYGTVQQAVNNRETLEARQERLLAVQTTMRVIAQDVNQLALRPVRDPSGNSTLPVLRAAGSGDVLLELTRGGWANPAGVQRPALQRVSYILENKVLRREYRPVLDALLSVQNVRRELCTRVTSVTFRYMDIGRQWRETWPPPTAVANQNDTRLRPVAIEVTIELEDWGKIRRIFEVPT
jgi:general secretion pathway protein J